MRLLPVVALLASPALAQVNVGLGETCDGELAADRACVEIEGSLLHLTDLRNELTRGMIDAGGGDCGRVSCYVVLVCDQCSVDKHVEGCSLVGDRIVMSRWAVMAHRLGCVLTAMRGEAVARQAQAVVLERLNRAADMGDGTPIVMDRRAEAKEESCDEDGCG